MQVSKPASPASSTVLTLKPTSRPPSRRPSFASSYTSENGYVDMEYEDYTMIQQDLANVHFRFEEEEEYLSDNRMDEENPFHTPPLMQHYMDGIKENSNSTFNVYSPNHSSSPNNQHKLKRSFGMENISPLYFYNNKSNL
eukprot:Phypoly_transcript_27001.p1 GENE.Phypoly_transcript_27001~~Phypoly_transcript_27001.p1  ORF type:complete len:140 (+),score=22.10 Phypoly_transcript_27001:66-485(+)